MHIFVHFRAKYNNQDKETTQMFNDKWIYKEMWFICIIEYYETTRKDEIMHFAAILMDWMV